VSLCVKGLKLKVNLFLSEHIFYGLCAYRTKSKCVSMRTYFFNGLKVNVFFMRTYFLWTVDTGSRLHFVLKEIIGYMSTSIQTKYNLLNDLWKH